MYVPRTDRLAILVSWTVSLLRDGLQVCTNACEWSRTDWIDVCYLKRESAAIPARHAFSNAPRAGTVIDKTIRKLPGLLEIIAGSHRSVRNTRYDFRSNQCFVTFLAEIKRKPSYAYIGNLLLTKTITRSDK